MTTDLVEKCARALWNQTPRIIERLEPTTSSSLEYQRRGVPVLWDDEDMLERDRVLTRARALAVIDALADGVTPEMWDAFWHTFNTDWDGNESPHALSAAIRAAKSRETA